MISGYFFLHTRPSRCVDEFGYEKRSTRVTEKLLKKTMQISEYTRVVFVGLGLDLGLCNIVSEASFRFSEKDNHFKWWNYVRGCLA